MLAIQSSTSIYCEKLIAAIEEALDIAHMNGDEKSIDQDSYRRGAIRV